jgi:hypothetical protein
MDITSEEIKSYLSRFKTPEDFELEIIRLRKMLVYAEQVRSKSMITKYTQVFKILLAHKESTHAT